MNNRTTQIIDKDDDMLPEYDFSGGVRGKHALAMQRGYKVRIHKLDGTIEERDYQPAPGVVILDEDVRKYFPNSEAVNKALRSLIELIPQPAQP